LVLVDDGDRHSGHAGALQCVPCQDVELSKGVGDRLRQGRRLRLRLWREQCGCSKRQDRAPPQDNGTNRSSHRQSFIRYRDQNGL